jgi:carbamoyltransferase
VQVVGIHSAGHDTGVSLWEDGRLLYSVETERLTRRRHDHAAEVAVEALRSVAEFDPQRVGMIAVSTGYRQALVQIENSDHVRSAIAGKALHVETRCNLLGRPVPCVVVAHEASHAAIALHYADDVSSALILVNEGRGSFSRNSLFDFSSDRLSLVETDTLPWFGNGFGWSAIGQAIGLGRGPSVAGKVMALGGFSEPDPSLMDAILSIAADLDTADETRLLAERSRLLASVSVENFDDRAALISSFQKLFTQEVTKLLDQKLAERPREAVALGGGCALNIVANAHLRNRLQVPVVIPPAPNDAGQALGAALYAMRFVMGIRPQPFPVYSVGATEDTDAIMNTLQASGLSWRAYNPEHVAESLAAGKVLAFMHGKAECGPRALGNRSILAHPSMPGMKEKVSEKIKKREWFRPLAPVMREERLSKLRPDAPSSPFMLFNYDSGGLQLSQASHVDGTARIQTVRRDDNPKIHQLLECFEKASGENGLINTSLNAGGKPIAQTTRDVLDDFWSTDIDMFVFGDLVVERENMTMAA